MPKMLPPVAGIAEPSAKFEKQLKSLSKRTQKQLQLVVDELVVGELLSGRNLEKFAGLDDVYTVRLNKKERFAFLRNPDDTIKPIAAGSHDVVYRIKKHNL